jgi:6,7-dimethyl-8-ribityllumazine synthase
MASTPNAAPQNEIIPSGAGRRIGIVAASWHGAIVDTLLTGAVTTLEKAGVLAADIVIVRCPGSYEIPVCVKAMATHQRVEAVIALGVIIRGETAHFEYVSSPVAHALMDISVDTGVPCVFGVLTTENEEQAWARAGGHHGNKGSESAVAALELAEILQRLRRQKP